MHLNMSCCYRDKCNLRHVDYVSEESFRRPHAPACLGEAVKFQLPEGLCCLSLFIHTQSEIIEQGSFEHWKTLLECLINYKT